MPAKWNRRPAHRLADLVDSHDEASIARLVERMKRDGFNPEKPIVLLDDLVLDGRGRQEAAWIADVFPIYINYEDYKLATHYGSPAEFVLAENVDRRHLAPGRAAVVAALLAEDIAAQRAAGQLPKKKGDAAKIAAAATGVPERTIYRTLEVVRNGAPEVVQALKDGVITTTDAATVSRLPQPEQVAAVAAVKSAGRRTTATKAAKSKRVTCDPAGTPIPDRLRQLFTGDPFATEVTLLRQLAGRFRKCNPWLPCYADHAERQFRELAKHIESNPPAFVCHACKGNGKKDGTEEPCRICKGCGWLPERIGKQANKETVA